MSLIKLDTGDYLDPRFIKAIRCVGENGTPRVVIDTLGSYFVVHKDSLTDCFAYADKLAKEIKEHE